MARVPAIETMRHPARRRAGETRVDRLVTMAAGFSLLAAAIHVAVMPEHVHESWLFAAAFGLMAVAQALWGAAILAAPSKLGYGVGAVINGGIVVLWVTSRTVGLPVGPHHWTPESISFADLTATTCELIVVAVAVSLGRSIRPGEPAETVWREHRPRWVDGIAPVWASVPVAVRAGFVLLLVGVVVSIGEHAGSAHGSPAHGGGALIGHLVILAGMVTALAGVFAAGFRSGEKRSVE